LLPFYAAAYIEMLPRSICGCWMTIPPHRFPENR
jgi:hypothetical protein